MDESYRLLHNLTNYDKRRANNGRKRNPKMAGLDLDELKRYFLKSRGSIVFYQCHKGIEMRKQGNILQKGSDDPVEDQVLLPLASEWAKSICLYLYPTQRTGGIINTTDSS